MAIDLSRFTKEKTVIMPIVEGVGVYEGRKIYQTGLPSAWYTVYIGNDIRIGAPASLLEIEEEKKKYKTLLGYSLGSEVVPVNFQNLFHVGGGESVVVNFLTTPAWDIVRFFCYPDRRFYFYDISFSSSRRTLEQLRERFEKDKSIDDIRGVTPEQRYYFLLLSLQRQSYRELERLKQIKLSEAERAKRLKEFQNTFSGRLKETVERAGGTLVRFEKTGKDRYVVTWKSGRQIVRSTINDRFKIYDLGFCAVNDPWDHEAQDKHYFLDSAIGLAKMFQEDAPLYITRE